MSVSAIFGTRITPKIPLLNHPTNTHNAQRVQLPSSPGYGTGSGAALIECSSRPQKKSTAHHMKTRPKKTQRWDRNRGPAVYPPLPPLPPDYTVLSPGTETDAASLSSAPAEAEPQADAV